MTLRSLLVLLALAPLAAAETITVPGDFETIQAAVDAAADGDTIVVAKGVYPGTVNLTQREGLVLRGKGKPVIDASRLVTGLLILQCDDNLVSGFVIEDALEEGILVQVSSDVTVRQCTVLEGCQTAGILVDGGLRVLLEKNRIEQTDNLGIELLSSDTDPTTDSQVLRNRIVSTAGMGIHVNGPDNIIERNVIEDCGVGVLMNVDSAGCTISRNKVLRATFSGIELLTGDGVQVERNTITDGDANGIFLSVMATGAATRKNKLVRSKNDAIVVIAGDCELEGDSVIDAETDSIEMSDNGNVLTGLRTVRGGEDAFQVLGNGNELTSCKASASGASGFSVIGTSNTLTKCRAKGSESLDLNDAGNMPANTYVDCKFGTSNLP